MVFALLGLHLIAAAAAPWLARRVGKNALLAVAVAPVATLLWLTVAAPGILAGQPVVGSLEWAPGLGFELAVKVDQFSLLMVVLISGIGALILAYASIYFAARNDIGRLAGLLVGFSSAMLGLVVSDNLLAIFLFWEATSITSYLLIGVDDQSATARSAALRALLTTGTGGLAMFGGFILLAQTAGTWSLSELLAVAPRGVVVEVALVLVLLGAFTKSAQVPFHFWLPGAMAAPTPVSAYLHSATMVKAGVYLIARLAPSFADASVWRPLVITVGLATMLLGGWRSLAQNDLKLLLAHGTTSQLGLMVVLLGAGYHEATLAGSILLLAHGSYKAALFMVVGIVDKQSGSRDIRRLTGLHRPLRTTFVIGLIAAGSMAGLPPLLGFVAKEAAYEAFLHADLGMVDGIIVGLLVLGSVLTFAYSVRALWGMFADKPAAEVEDSVSPASVGRPNPSFVAPAAILAVLTAVFGASPAWLSGVAVGGAQALDRLVATSPLRLWHGFNEALMLSIATIAGGMLLWRYRMPIGRLQQRLHIAPTGARAFDVVLIRTVRLAKAVTGLLQTGSLPLYLGIILTTVLVVPGGFLLAGMEMPTELLLVDKSIQLAVVTVMLVATVGAIKATHRLSAVLAVGAVGYGVAVLFVIQGAPDLALTQLLIETLVLVLFVLVLRHLPRRFVGRHTALSIAPRAVLSILVGTLAAVFTLVAFAARPDVPPVSDEYVAQALPEGGGRNVVNVILVDFRAFDTLGEIVVLSVAGLGVIGLVGIAQRERSRGGQGAPGSPYRPSLILDTAVRALFRTVILISVVLLLVGHDQPGGGFVGGLVAGAAFMLVYLAGGAPRLRRSEPVAPEMFLGTGIGLAILAGALGWLFGGEFLESTYLNLEIPVLGTTKISTVLLFDLGVYLVVVGLVVSLLRSPIEEVPKR